MLEPCGTRRRAAVSRTVEWRMARVHVFAARAGIVGEVLQGCARIDEASRGHRAPAVRIPFARGGPERVARACPFEQAGGRARIAERLVGR